MIKRVKEVEGTNALIASTDFRDFAEKFESEINRGISTLCILTVIKQSQHQELHGYAILKELNERTNNMLVIEEGTLYPLLRKLEDTDPKILESEKMIVEKRKRKVYRLTRNGEKMLNYLSGFFNKLLEAIGPLLDIGVKLEEKFLYCPQCANRIDLHNEEIQFCEVCGFPIQQIKERRLE